MCKRFNLGSVHISVYVDALCLFGKHHRNVKTTGDGISDCDAGCFYGQNLCYIQIRKASVKLPAYLVKKLHVHLMIEKAVNLKYVSFLNNSVP